MTPTYVSSCCGAKIHKHRLTKCDEWGYDCVCGNKKAKYPICEGCWNECTPVEAKKEEQCECVCHNGNFTKLSNELGVCLTCKCPAPRPDESKVEIEEHWVAGKLIKRTFNGKELPNRQMNQIMENLEHANHAPALRLMQCEWVPCTENAKHLEPSGDGRLVDVCTPHRTLLRKQKQLNGEQ